MSKISLSPNASGTGTFTIASPGTSTDRTLTLPDNSGTVITTASTGGVSQAMLASGVAGTGPAFSAYQSSGQSLSAGTSTKITFTTEDFDTANCFASSRFTPNVAGYYQFNCSVRADTTLQALHAKLSASTVGEFASGSFTNSSLASWQSSCSGIVYLNGSTDYVEVYAFSGSNVTLNAFRGATYFQGFLVRSAV